jgi:hypothetical protein
MAPSNSNPRNASSNKYTPAHGRHIEIAARVADDYETSRTRDRIAYLVLGGAAMAMVIASGYGFRIGDFAALRDVWTVAGPFAGAIVGYYFHRSRKDSL